MEMRTWTYTPLANYSGPVSFNFVVTDGMVTTSSTASLHVSPVNEVDTMPPSLLISSSDADGFLRETTTLTFDFSEEVIGFSAADISILPELGTLGALVKTVLMQLFTKRRSRRRIV